MARWFLVITLWSLVTVPGAQAATYHVSPSGQNSRTCAEAQSRSAPRQTITAGISCLAGGDTLVLLPGTYNELLDDYGGVPHAAGTTVPIPGGSAANPTVLRGEPGSRAVLRSSVQHGGCGSLLCLTKVQHVVFQDLIFEGEWVHDVLVAFGGDTTIPQHLRFENVEVRNAQGAGFNGQTDHLVLRNVDMHHNGWRNGQTTCHHSVCANPPGEMCHGYCHGLYVWGSHWLIEGGQVYDNDGYGLHIYKGPSTNVVVRGVTAYNNHKGPGIAIINGSDNQIYNNLTYGNTYGGILVSTARTTVCHNTVTHNIGGIGVTHPDTTVCNNIVAHNRDWDVMAWANGGGRMEHNLFYPTMTIQEDRPGMLTKSNNRLGDPQFMQMPTDLHLQQGSAAITTGMVPPMTGMMHDKDGVARSSSGPSDAGAYQYAAGSVPPAPKDLRLLTTP